MLLFGDPVCASRRKAAEHPTETQQDLKILMRKLFMPSHYYRDLYYTLQNLTLENSSVEDYFKATEMAFMRVDVVEDL